METGRHVALVARRTCEAWMWFEGLRRDFEEVMTALACVSLHRLLLARSAMGSISEELPCRGEEDRLGFDG